MNTRKLRTGLLGCGKIVELCWKSALNKMSEYFSIDAVSDVSSEKVDSIFDLKKTNYFQNYLSLIENSQLDLIIVTLPNYLHCRAIKDAVKRKIPVICEKPLVMNASELTEISELISRENVPVSVVHNYLCSPNRIEAKQLLDSNKVGRVLSIDMNIYTASHNDQNDDWRLNHEKSGGGVFLDIGYHYLYLAEYYAASSIKRLQLFTDNQSDSQIEKNAFCLAQHENGVFTKIMIHSFSSTSYKFPNKIRVTGSEGEIELEGIKKLEIAAKNANYLKEYPSIYDVGYPEILQDMRNHILNNSPLEFQYKSTLPLLNHIFEAYKSAGRY